VHLPQLSYVCVEDWILAVTSGKSVLHLGCAGDRQHLGPALSLHVALAKQASVLWGVERDAKALSTMRDWVPEDGDRIRYLEGDVQAIGRLHLPRRFEIVLAGSIIEHLECPGSMLSGLADTLEPDGRVIIVTPHAFGLLQYLRVAFTRREAVNPEHTCWYSIPTLSELCRRFGFEPVEWHTGHGWRPPSRSWAWQRWLGTLFFNRVPHLGGSLIGLFAQRHGTRPPQGL
jgi:SAM-dependent methyltransferase